MKKINNGKFRNNNSSSSNTIYSLNYKFDSVCSAGKFCGTALDLIKKYNELAKEAHSNGDYVEMEVFRQYAEHYRKIVTEINERKSQQRENNQLAKNTEETPAENAPVADNGLVETEAAPQEVPAPQKEEVATADKPVRRRRSFKIVTVGEEKNSEATGEEMPTAPVAEEKSAKRRIIHRKPRAPKEPENAE